MRNNEQNDKELNDYLNGDSDLSKAYRASYKKKPSPHLDDAILSAAKEAVNVSNNTKQKIKPKFHKAPWVKPLSVAAIVTLSVSLVVTMQQETGQPLINEPEVEIFDSSIIKKSSIPESIISSDGATVMNETESKQNKDDRIDTSAPAASGMTADIYRAEEKTELPKARMKAAPAKKMLLKEKSQLEAIEERAFVEEQVLPSAPTGVEFDDAMDMEQARDLSLQKDALLEIKTLWDNGDIDKAKQAYDDFTSDYPDATTESIKLILGENVYNELLHD